MCLRQTCSRADLGTGRDGATATRAAPHSPAGARAAGATVDRALAILLRGLITLYRYLLSPFLPQTCRYAPTCSAYAAEAVQLHGAFVGSWLALRRVARCHPWGGSGYDPVPEDPRRSRATERHSPVPDAPEPIGPPA